MTTEEVQRISQQILDRQGFIIVPKRMWAAPGLVIGDVGMSVGPLGAALVVIEESTRQDYEAQIALAAAIIGPGYRPPPAPPLDRYFFRAKAE